MHTVNTRYEAKTSEEFQFQGLNVRVIYVLTTQ